MSRASDPLPHIVAAGICVGCAVAVVLIGDLRAGAVPFLGLASVWSVAASLAAWRARLPLWSVLALAVVLRVALLASEPTLSDDLFRYLWEGRVQLAGFDPFLYAPSAPELAELHNGTWEQVAHKDVSTIYPPGALWLFRAVAWVWEDPILWKAVAGACDLGIVLLLARHAATPRWAVALYALHPLPIIEAAGSGHLESIALLGLVAGLTTRGGAFLVGLGGLVKLLPFVAWLPMLRERPRAAVGMVASLALGAVLLLPFLGPTLLRGFETYYEVWAFNSSGFRLLALVFDEPRPIGVAIGAVACAVAAWRLRDPADLVLFVASALLLLSPVVHPWYVLWAFVPACLRGRWAWAVIASTTLLSYAVLVGYDPDVPGSWEEPAWVVWVSVPPWIAAVAWSTWRGLRSPDSPAG
ncbi:MAG: DUF2029 domain-containing protein [Proteobacteria bacterium]|nr:DUF2029 domain-containing protein [Pseudomonadota bacterium]MCP4916072.1 DUF2029 domain-containing protein [Pseudomonadota bacterium]